MNTEIIKKKQNNTNAMHININNNIDNTTNNTYAY